MWIQKEVQLTINHFVFLLCILFFVNSASAKTSDWAFVIPDKLQKPTRTYYVERMQVLFTHFLQESLRSQGKGDFETVVKRVRNRIFWKVNQQKKNVFLDAFHRSYPDINQYELPADVPQIVLLVPYLESLWRAKAGEPAKDYGYWQLLNAIVKEIKTLPTTPAHLKKMSVNKIRTHHKYSTEVALIHLRRYYFYFHKIAGFHKADAWMFSILAYNWGSGNVRRLLRKMKKKKIKRNFSNFYHFLYQQHLQNEDDRSLRTAVEYLPHLWNIALVIEDAPSS